MADYYLKVGDRAPSLEVTLLEPDDTPTDLTGVSGVVCRFRQKNKAEVLSGGACSIVDAAVGRVRYDWSAEDSDQSGAYWMEFTVTRADGKEMTYPSNGYFEVVIDKRLE